MWLLWEPSDIAAAFAVPPGVAAAGAAGAAADTKFWKASASTAHAVGLATKTATFHSILYNLTALYNKCT